MDYLINSNLYLHGRDLDGKLILMFKGKLHVRGRRNMNDLKRCLVYWIERGLRQTKNDQITVIFDMSDTGLSNVGKDNLWQLKNRAITSKQKFSEMEYTRAIINTFKNYYPNTPNWILVYDMPWIMNGEWKLVKAFESFELSIISSSHLSNRKKASAEKSRWAVEVHQREKRSSIHRRRQHAGGVGRKGWLRFQFCAWKSRKRWIKIWERRLACHNEQQQRGTSGYKFIASEGGSDEKYFDKKKERKKLWHKSQILRRLRYAFVMNSGRRELEC